MANENMDIWKTDMNVIRETVRVVKEEIEKNPEFYDKYHKTHPKGGRPDIGQTAISNFLGGPWKQRYQIRLIAEALAQLRDMEEGIINQEGDIKGEG